MDLYDWFQWRQIKQAQGTADRAAAKIEDARTTVENLERELQRLSLVTQAVWETLRDVAGVPDAALAAKIKEIDLRDGVADGRYRKPMTTCGSCGRRTPPKNAHCYMCGAALKQVGPFDAKD